MWLATDRQIKTDHQIKSTHLGLSAAVVHIHHHQLVLLLSSKVDIQLRHCSKGVQPVL